MYNLKHKSESWLLAAFVAFALSAMPTVTQAQTMVSGNISGSWSPSGNPYIVTDNATVPSGQTLTIQPGVTVWIAENISITANGLIQAVGTPTQRITFQAPIASQYWSNIVLNYWAGVTNRFKYCDFSNARTAISINAYASNDTMPVEIMNCSFSNCTDQAVYGQATGDAVFTIGGVWYASSGITPVIKNCNFTGIANGCSFYIAGGRESAYGNIGYGYGSLQIMGNVFRNVTNVAVSLVVGSYSADSAATLINNTVVNAGSGVMVQDPWNARVQNNIFVGTTNAVKTSGALSRTVSYNCFYGNATNFTGYPSSYGQIILQNRNGTPSDLLYNIFQDPLFVATNDFHLASNSPCIDPGTPDWAFTDMCFPPSLGTSFPDLGAYGGPDAANWLDVVPKLPVQAFMTKTSGGIWVNWGALPRSSYQVQYLTNLSTMGANVWTDFTGGLVLATEKPTSLQVAASTATNEMFFRVQSLGRAIGN